MTDPSAHIAAAPLSAAQPDDDTLLLVLPTPLLIKDGAVAVESQAGDGLEQWAANFERITLAAPVIPDWLERSLAIVWRDVGSLSCRDRLETVSLPWAHHELDFLRTYRATRRQLGGLISRHRYLHFAVHSLVGDWASVAALDARCQGRAFSVFSDNVAHKVLVRAARQHSFLRWLKMRLEAPIMKRYQRHVIRGCDLGLWHGYDCFAEYSGLCKASFIVHNIHTKPSDCISPEATRAKADEARAAQRLRICYAGRAIPIKAPLDWLRTIARVRELGVKAEAVWLGDGSMLEEMRAMRDKLGLAEVVDLPGFVGDHGQVLDALRRAHILVFTHITPESPRCLIESLICGTPIAGYEGGYARDLVKDHGGGAFVPVHDWRALAQRIAELWGDREQLANLTMQAGANGARFNNEACFRERAALMKRYLP